jgi:hypothetical protein
MHPDKIKEGILSNKKYFEKHSPQPFRATIGLIVGLPYETFDTLNATRQWLIDYWQGQSFVTWGLEIYNPDSVENNSTLSLDYKKYGYEQIVDQEILKNSKSLIPEMYHKMGERFLWKNQHMDFLKAQQYAIDVHNTLYCNYDFRPLSNDLFRFQLANKDLSFEEICKKPTTHLRSNFNDQKFVDAYIAKKLSL